MRVRALLGAVVLMLLTAGMALAWPEGPPDKVSISGPGIAGTLEVTGKGNLEGLGPTQFMDFKRNVTSAPQVQIDRAYVVTRYVDGFGPSGTFDLLHYYPGKSGNSGYIHYVKAIGYGPTNMTGRWFYATLQGDATMLGLLAKYATSPEEPSAQAQQSQETPARHGALCSTSYKTMLVN